MQNYSNLKLDCLLLSLADLLQSVPALRSYLCPWDCPFHRIESASAKHLAIVVALIRSEQNSHFSVIWPGWTLQQRELIGKGDFCQMEMIGDVLSGRPAEKEGGAEKEKYEKRGKLKL